jgi:MFS family permease
MGPAVRQFLPPDQLPRASVYIGGLLPATMVGWAAGGVAAGVAADYFGRRRTLMLSILCYAVFTGLAALSWDYWSLLIFRFLTGLGLGAEWGPGAAIVAEFWPPKSRGRAGGALHAAYGVGLLLASGIWLLLNPLGRSSWRYMFVVGIVPAFLLLCVRRWVREPVLWVAASRDWKQAEQRIQKGTGSSHDKHLTRFTISEILSDVDLRRRVGLCF